MGREKKGSKVKSAPANPTGQPKAKKRKSNSNAAAAQQQQNPNMQQMQNSNYQIAPPFDEFSNQQPAAGSSNPQQQMQMNGAPPPSNQPPQRLTPQQQQQRMQPMSGPNQPMHPNYKGPMGSQNGNQMMQPNYSGPMSGGQMPPHNGQMMGMQSNQQPMSNSYNQPPQMMQQQLGSMNLPPNQQQMKMMSMNAGSKMYTPGQGPPDCLNAQLGPMDRNGNLANGGRFYSTNSNAPPTYICRTCEREVHENEQNIMCDANCKWFYHRTCTNLTDAAFTFLKTEVYVEWCCDICEQTKPIPPVKFK